LRLFIREPELGLAGLDFELAYAGFLAGDVKDAPGEFPGGQPAFLRAREEVRFP
jgi:hypothetical protein